MTWYHVSNAEKRARWLADRHYSRQHIGATHFMPPGYGIVLLSVERSAVFAISRCAPHILRADGYQCWSNTIFRNESQRIASELITEALAACVYLWRDIPPDGLHTFIDPVKVKPTIRRGSAMWGYCYIKAGFEPAGVTKDKGLLRFILSAEKLRAIVPQQPLYEQLRMAL